MSIASLYKIQAESSPRHDPCAQQCSSLRHRTLFLSVVNPRSAVAQPPWLGHGWPGWAWLASNIPSWEYCHHVSTFPFPLAAGERVHTAGSRSAILSPSILRTPERMQLGPGHSLVLSIYHLLTFPSLSSLLHSPSAKVFIWREILCVFYLKKKGVGKRELV